RPASLPLRLGDAVEGPLHALDLSLEPVPLAAEILLQPDPIVRAHEGAGRIVDDRWRETRRMLLKDYASSVEVGEKVSR
ncbi:MAG: hypothetical protein ACRDK0_07315, partial [Solirubrobacteraceae bacterium]